MLVLFPGALGDFLCLWPALEALRRSSPAPLTLVAKPELFDLLAPRPDGTDRLISFDAREVADLFASGPPGDATLRAFAGHAVVHGFAAAGDESFARRLAAITGGTVALHRIRGMRDGEHASRYFARCLGVTPRTCALVPNEAAQQWAEELWRDARLGDRALAIHPGSGGRAKNWSGMAEIARLWRAREGGRVIAIAGPAEPAAEAIPHDVLLRDEPLSRVGAAIRRAALYLGNDSGVSHLAGLVGARGAVLFGASDPAIWRPNGAALEVVVGRPACGNCDPGELCTHRLPVDAVWRTLAELA
jgi:ADP-heptose:LPS heptosyltransferase